MNARPWKGPWLLPVLAMFLAPSPSSAEVLSFTGPAGTLLTGDPGISARNLGWGYFDMRRSGPCIPEELRREMVRRARQNAAALDLPVERTRRVAFGWPLAPAPHMIDFGYHGTSGFVDQDPGYPDQRLDYNRDTRT